MRIFPRKKHQNRMGNNTLTEIHFTVTTFQITQAIMMTTPNIHGSDSWRPKVLSRVETAVMWPNTCILTSPEPLSLELRSHQAYFPPRTQPENNSLQARLLSPCPSSQRPTYLQSWDFLLKQVQRALYNIQEQSKIHKSPIFPPILERAPWRD